MSCMHLLKQSHSGDLLLSVPFWYFGLPTENQTRMNKVQIKHELKIKVSIALSVPKFRLVLLEHAHFLYEKWTFILEINWNECRKIKIIKQAVFEDSDDKIDLVLNLTWNWSKSLPDCPTGEFFTGNVFL
jgi:hypothetical protein